MDSKDLEKLRNFRNLHNPYCQRQGIVVQELRPGYARVTKTVAPDDVNPLNVPHGGLYFTMADNACGSAMVGYGYAGSLVRQTDGSLKNSEDGMVFSPVAEADTPAAARADLG